MEVKLASSSLSLHDLRAHHHLFMDSYCPTMSTPCKVFLDLLVCIQRAAAKIVVLANGLDHIIPPFSPPWHPPFSAPIAECSSSISQPLIIHLSSTPSSPMQQKPCSLPIPTSPFMLPWSVPHLGEAPSECLQSHCIALPGALLCHGTRSTCPRGAAALCSSLNGG